MLSNAKRVYAVTAYTVERRAAGWFYWPTYGSKDDIKGPYSSEASVSLMIARNITREVKRRDAVHNLPE